MHSCISKLGGYLMIKVERRWFALVWWLFSLVRSMSSALAIAGVISVSLASAAPCIAKQQMTTRVALEQLSGARFVGMTSSGKTEVTLMLERGTAQSDGTVAFSGHINSVAVKPGGHTEPYFFKKAIFDPRTNLLTVPTSKGTAILSWDSQTFSGDIKVLFVTISTVTLQKQ